MSITELYKFKINRKQKLIILFISILITLIIFIFLPEKTINEPIIKNDSHERGLEKLLVDDERLISLKITNPSKFILDSINSVVNIDIIKINKSGLSNIVTRNAKLIEIDKKFDQDEGVNFYVLSIIVNKHEARKILKIRDADSLSIMISSDKEENLKKDSNTDVMNDLEIIEEEPYENE